MEEPIQPYNLFVITVGLDHLQVSYSFKVMFYNVRNRHRGSYLVAIVIHKSIRHPSV